MNTAAEPEVSKPSPDPVQSVNPVETDPDAPLPARVTLKDGLLTVEANNSPLTDILNKISAAGGMEVDGHAGESRVYGNYGPGKPEDVISGLLAGAGYNFMMVGTNPEGTPRKLLLTPKGGGASPPQPSALAAGVDHGADAEREPLGPGAIENVPPPPPEDPAVRMQQRLEQLQHRQEQLKQPEPEQAPAPAEQPEQPQQPLQPPEPQG